MKKLLICGLLSLAVSTNLFGAKVTALKTTIAEEGFQLYVVTEILKKMGHEVEISNDVGYDIAFQTIANNAKNDDVYFMASHWDPLQNTMIKGAGGKEKIAKFAPYISNCAQGYLIDKKTADKYNIKYINDLDDPKIAKLFDTDGDGKADLTGCDAGWGCSKVISYQLDKFNLKDNIDYKQGSYAALIADTIANYKTGKSILYYTWTPYWVSGKLVPGKDVVFLQVTHHANPNTKSTKLPNGADYGFNANSQHIVANKSVLKNHKDIAKLFDIVKLSVNDISGQNMLMANGQNKEKDIKRHTAMWLKHNAKKVNAWIAEAKATK
jgi:glycine betaine/proline transport system substrate-binding protein